MKYDVDATLARLELVWLLGIMSLAIVLEMLLWATTWGDDFQ